MPIPAVERRKDGEDFRMLPFLPSFLLCKLGESCEICEIDARCTSDFMLSITDL